MTMTHENFLMLKTRILNLERKMLVESVVDSADPVELSFSSPRAAVRGLGSLDEINASALTSRVMVITISETENSAIENVLYLIVIQKCTVPNVSLR
jgi:hypothetical protein